MVGSEPYKIPVFKGLVMEKDLVNVTGRTAWQIKEKAGGLSS